ncbi:MAG: hypothetical protein ACRELY_14445 [Polyangiaceae bacterium]
MVVVISGSLMRSLGLLGAASFVLLVLSPKVASAGSCDNPQTSACIDSDTLWPHVGPSRFVAIGGTQTIEPGKIGFGLITDYQSRPIRVHSSSPGPLGTDVNAVNDQVSSTFAFDYGVTKKLELGIMIPLTLGQGGSGTSAISGGDDLRDTAVRDLRFGFAYSIVTPKLVEPEYVKRADAADGLGLAARSEMSAPTGDKEQFAGEEGAVYIPSVAADYRVGRLFFAAEAGARIRQTAQFLNTRIGTQLAFGLGAGFDILSRERLSVSAEARALPTLTEQTDASTTAGGIMYSPNGKFITPAEWLLAVRSAPFRGGDFAAQLAGGGSIPTGGDSALTVPRVRFVLSLVFEPRGYDSDGDGVPDREDACPSVAAPRSNTKPGCPEPPPPPQAPPPPQDFLSPPPPLPTSPEPASPIAPSPSPLPSPVPSPLPAPPPATQSTP